MRPALRPMPMLPLVRPATAVVVRKAAATAQTIACGPAHSAAAPATARFPNIGVDLSTLPICLKMLLKKLLNALSKPHIPRKQ